MNDNEILEGNKLIAEFMGGAYNKQNDDFMFVLGNCPTKHASCMWDAVALRYHSSWDWLMPVVEKIESLDATVIQIINHSCEVISKCFQETKPELEIFSVQKIKIKKIESVWLAVVDFIKWYNQNKQ